MTLDEAKDFLIWSTVINYGILLVWFGVFACAHDRVFRMHSRWFTLTSERFDAINYGAMAIYKIGVLLLNVAPLIALGIIS